MVRQRCVNPYYHRINFQPFELFKVVLGCLLLVPIRVVLILLLFFIASGLSKLFIFILSHINKDKNLDNYHYWRIKFKNFVRYIFRAILFCCGFYKVNIIQIGDIEKEKDAPIYVFAPHTSLFDILAGVALGAPSSVAKADIVNIPLFGNIFRLSDPVLVERDSKDSRGDVLNKVAQVIKYSKIVFFPEATCSNHRALLQFKPGAFRPGYPVIPVSLRFEQYGPDTLSWTWDGVSPVWSIIFTLARWQTDLEIKKLDVYYPSEEEKSNQQLYADNVEKILSEDLELPCLYYSFDDARYFKYNFFRSSTNVKFLKFIDKIRQTRQLKPNGNSISTNGIHTNGSTKQISKKKSQEILFTTYLYDFIDNVKQNLKTVELNSSLDAKGLFKILNIDSEPDIINSYSLKEFLHCLNKIDKLKFIHLKIILNAVDLRIEKLSKRLQLCYESFKKSFENESSTLSFEDLQTFLWIIFSIEDVNEDKEVKDIEILSYDDLQNLLINHYEFALIENGGTICKELFIE